MQNLRGIICAGGFDSTLPFFFDSTGRSPGTSIPPHVLKRNRAKFSKIIKTFPAEAPGELETAVNELYALRMEFERKLKFSVLDSETKASLLDLEKRFEEYEKSFSSKLAKGRAQKRYATSEHMPLPPNVALINIANQQSLLRAVNFVNAHTKKVLQFNGIHTLQQYKDFVSTTEHEHEKYLYYVGLDSEEYPLRFIRHSPCLLQLSIAWSLPSPAFDASEVKKFPNPFFHRDFAHLDAEGFPAMESRLVFVIDLVSMYSMSYSDTEAVQKALRSLMFPAFDTLLEIESKANTPSPVDNAPGIPYKNAQPFADVMCLCYGSGLSEFTRLSERIPAFHGFLNHEGRFVRHCDIYRLESVFPMPGVIPASAANLKAQKKDDAQLPNQDDSAFKDITSPINPDTPSENALSEEGVVAASTESPEDDGPVDTDAVQDDNAPKPLASGGLSSLTAALFGLPLKKYLTLSDWLRRPLMPHKIDYAALDAWILHGIFKKFYEVHGNGLFTTDYRNLKKKKSRVKNDRSDKGRQNNWNRQNQGALIDGAPQGVMDDSPDAQVSSLTAKPNKPKLEIVYC